MKNLLLATILSLPLLTTAQKVGFALSEPGNEILADFTGSPLKMRTEYYIEGTPFVHNEYCTANVKVRAGKRHEGVPIKLNLEDNQVYFKMPDGREMQATTPVESIEFTGGCNEEDATTRTFRSGFPAVDGQTEKCFYEILAEGDLQLLKLFKVSYLDSKGYSSATITRTYQTTAQYYAYSPEKGMVKLSKDNDAVIRTINDKKGVVASYVDHENLKVRKETDLVKLFLFYNSLNNGNRKG